MRSKAKLAGTILTSLFLAACSSSRPVLYPNAHLVQEDPEVVQADIEECQSLAAGHGTAAHRVPQETVVNSTVTVLTSILSAAFNGDFVGVADAGANRLLNALGQSSTRDSERRTFTEQCLRDKGYDLVGWR